jgi:hypothetical protein
MTLTSWILLGVILLLLAVCSYVGWNVYLWWLLR